MTKNERIRIAVIGASGYTGADLVRLAAQHPHIEITALVAKNHAGKPIRDVFPHLDGLNLPDLVNTDDVDFEGIDAAIIGLPHGAAHEIVAALPKSTRIVDMSADFRLDDAEIYSQWYGREHAAPDLLDEAVYGLTEHNRLAITSARLVACPGCYPTATLLALLPLVSAQSIDPSDIIADAKSGVSGAGRSPKQTTLFCESGEGLSPYSVASHRHAPEIEQELSKCAGYPLVINFTPHLVPMSRGELVTCYVRLKDGHTIKNLRTTLEETYKTAPFVRVLSSGTAPATQHVRGSNVCTINVFEDRIPGRAIVVAALDNLVKGSAGQALQNLNLMFDWPETTCLEQVALFP